MATYRGLDGALHFGGVVTGTPTLNGAVANGESTATIDGGGSALSGVVIAGDEFTVGDDPQTYEVTSGAAVDEGTDSVTISFTPTVQEVGGWTDDDAVTFTSNLAAEVTSWEMNVSRDLLEDTSMGDTSKTFKAGLGEWDGTAQAWLDYADAAQAKVVDDIITAGADQLGVTFVVETDKQFYGQVSATGFNISSELSGIVQIQFNFKGASALAADWT